MKADMKKTKIAVFVSGGGSNLQAIIDYAEEGNIPHGELALVVSSSYDAYALVRANLASIPSVVVARKENSQEEFERKILAELEKHNIDMIVLAGFMSILSKDFVKRFPERIINVHPSLIPAFCGKGYYGLRVHEAALEKGVKVSGATVHIVTPECDAGPIVLQRAVEVRDDDTPETLQLRIMQEAEWKILPEAVRLFSDRRVTVKDNKVYIN